MKSKYFWIAMPISAAISFATGVFQVIVRGRSNLDGDGLYWHLAAKYFSEGAGFPHPMFLFFSNIETPAADHPPIFIIYLGALSKLGFNSVLSHQIATAALALIVVPLFGLVGRRIGGNAVGIVAMLLSALNPLMWGWAPLVMSEPMAVIFVLALVLVAMNYWDRKINSEQSLFKIGTFLGIITGIATLTRSELLLTGGLIILIVTSSRQVSLWLKRLFIVGLSCVVTLTPWVGYNLSRFEEPVLLSIGSDITFASAYCDRTYYGETIGYWSFACQEDAWDYAHSKVAELNPDQSQLMPHVKEYWRSYVAKNKLRTVQVIPLRLGRALGVYQLTQQINLEQMSDRRSKEATMASWILYFAMIPLAFLGWRLSTLSFWKRIILLVPILASLVTVAITWGNPRYRFSIDVILILFASIAICQIYRSLISQRSLKNENLKQVQKC